MPSVGPVSPLARLTAILTFVTVTGILYVGRDILVLELIRGPRSAC